MAGFELDILGESLHKGRPKDEEPHVKRAVSKKGKEAGIEYIVRIDLVRFSIDFRVTLNESLVFLTVIKIKKQHFEIP